MDNTVTLNRSVLTSNWFLEPHVAQVFLYLLFAAAHTGFRIFSHDIPRGSAVTSQHAIADETKLSEYRIGKVLKFLTDNGHIAIERRGCFSVVTICHFEEIIVRTAAPDSPEPSAVEYADNRLAEDMTDYWNKECPGLPRAKNPNSFDLEAIHRLVVHFDYDYMKTRRKISEAIRLISRNRHLFAGDYDSLRLNRLISDPAHLVHVSRVCNKK